MTRESSTGEVESPVEATELTESVAGAPDVGGPDVGGPDVTELDTADLADGPRPGAFKRALSWCGRRWGSVTIAALLVLSAGGAGGVYWWIYRPDQQTNAVAEKQAVDAAKDGTVALLSYAPDTLDQDLAKAKSHLTGEFLTYYSQFTDTIVKPAASKKGVKTEANVVRAAVSQMRPDSAVVLVFVNQVTTSKDRPEPALATSAVMVSLVRKSDHWLISEFKPV